MISQVGDSASPVAMPSRYEFLEKLGAGGMGVVYKARDIRLDRPVVLKFLAAQLSEDDTAKRRFVIEAQAAAALEHPNICTIHEIGEMDNGQLYIAMAYYDGETISRRIERGPLTVSDAVGIATDMTRGLAKAHERGIVHRDIKPANVIVTPEGAVKILDFGIAKLADAQLTQTGARIGTLAYMSPEQAFGDVIDHRTDIWSLGVVLYEMLTATHPLRAGNEQATLYSILTQEPAPVNALRSGVPMELDALLKRMLAKQPPDRPESMRDITAELTAIGAALTVGRSRRPVSMPVGASSGIRGPGLSNAGERRQATILISQICGYQSLVERRSPEDVDRITEEIRSAAMELTAQYGGIVNHFTGEELVVLFGVPRTNEDDFIRSARCALALHARVRTMSAPLEQGSGPVIRLRSGMHTGVVVTQKLLTGDRRYRVAGPPLSMAMRLASLAEPDAILVNPDFQRLIAPFFKAQPVAPVTLEAGQAPVIPYRVLGETGLHTRLDAGQHTGLTPYTGHARELELLGEKFELARRGNGQVAIVVGDVGVGKSRLLYELRLRHANTKVRVLRGSCDAYGSATPYRPFVEALRGALGFRTQQESGIDGVVAGIRMIDPSLEDYIPLYLHLLSFTTDAFPFPRHLQGDRVPGAMMEAVVAVLTLQAKRTPTILLLEDWHWSDDGSRMVLQQLQEIVAAYPLFLIVSSRPDPSIEWGSGDHQTLLHLGPLNAAASLAIMKSVLGVERISEQLVNNVMERAGGNPFFLEEICQTLVETGIAGTESGVARVADATGIVKLPHTVQAVIRTRVDLLDADAREVLRVASVIGPEFGRDILEGIADPQLELPPTLERLKASGLLQQTSVGPEPAYRFKHILTQEVAYDSLLEHQRTLLHDAAGRAIERIHPDRIDEHVELLARHFSRAEQWPKAVRYGIQAAERASTLSRFAEALNSLDRVLEWLSRIPEGENRGDFLQEVLFRQERLCETLGLRDRQQRIVDDLIALLTPQGESKLLAEAYLRKGDLCTLLRQFQAADEALDTSLRTSRSFGDSTRERHALRSLGLLRWHEGKSDAAQDFMEQALFLDREREDEEAVEGDLSNIGHILKGTGQHERALLAFEEALEISIRLRDPVKQLYILHGMGNVHKALGHMDKALECFRQADETARSRKLPLLRIFHLTSIAHLELQQGHVEESLQLYREAVEVSRRARHAEGLAQSLRMLGELLFGLGRDAEALPLFSEGAALFAQLENHDAEALMRSRLATACERLERFDEAVGAWQLVRSLRRGTGDAAAELEAAEGIARANRKSGNTTATVEQYDEAMRLAAQTGARSREATLCNTLGILEWQRGNYESALDYYERSAKVFGELGDRVHEGLIINSIGVTLMRLQRYHEALTVLESAVSHNRETGERLLEAHSLASLGEAYLAQGRLAESQDSFERSLAIRREIRDRRGEGWVLLHLSRVLRSRGDEVAARTFAGEAARIATESQDARLLAESTNTS